jgi:hypothetical protein
MLHSRFGGGIRLRNRVLNGSKMYRLNQHRRAIKPPPDVGSALIRELRVQRSQTQKKEGPLFIGDPGVKGCSGEDKRNQLTEL